MNWTIHYFNQRVQREITTWPVGIYANFLRLVLLLEEHGADLRLPHSRTLGDGLFELRCKGEERRRGNRSSVLLHDDWTPDHYSA
jgi:hypothetical protein